MPDRPPMDDVLTVVEVLERIRMLIFSPWLALILSVRKHDRDVCLINLGLRIVLVLHRVIDRGVSEKWAEWLRVCRINLIRITCTPPQTQVTDYMYV